MKDFGIEFVEATAPDPTSEAGVTGAQQFILEDVPKMVESTARTLLSSLHQLFYAGSAHRRCFQSRRYLHSALLPSPYHGFPSALGLDVPEDIVGGFAGCH